MSGDRVAADPAAAAATLGEGPVARVERVPSFAANEVYRVMSPQRVRYLKFASSADIGREAAVLDLLAGVGVPVPVVEAADVDGNGVGRPALLIRAVVGRPLEGREAAFGEAGRILRRVHEIPVAGFGPLEPGPLEPGPLEPKRARAHWRSSPRALEPGESPAVRGSLRSWRDAMEGRVAALGPVAGSGLVPGALVEAGAEAVLSRSDLFAATTAGRLLHGDFHPRHVYAEGGRVTGIIDWGDASGGDPVSDLARTFVAGLVGHDLFAGWDLLDRLRRGYGGDRPEPELVLVHAAASLLWGMKGEWEGGAPWPPWWPEHAAALDAVVNALA